MFRLDLSIVLIVLLLFCGTLQNSSADGRIEIARNGEPKAVIVIAENPTLAAAFAAQELREHIKLITGAQLKIVKDTGYVRGPRLIVGNCTAAQNLGMSSYSWEDQEYALKFVQDAVVLIGKDKNIPAPKDGPLPLPNFYENKGTMTAVYDFLYNYCGVRWYVPGDIGTCYDKKPTLIVRGKNVRRTPDMKYVWLYNTELWMPTREDNVARPIANLWKLRIGMGGTPYHVNHSFYGYYDRFLKEHPDWFAQGYSDREQPPQMCYTNPGFIAQVVQDARDYFDGKGLKPGAVAMGDVFGLVPMDNNAYCKCERCSAQLQAEDDKTMTFSSGRASDYIWGFVNEVAKEVKKTHPDKYVGALSYWDYATYPTKMKLEPNIAVMLCMNTREWYRKENREVGMHIYNSWVTKEKDRPIYLWLYFCFPALAASGGQFNIFPGYYASTAVKHSEMFSRDNIRGVFMEHSSEANMSHLLDVPELYLTTVMGRDSRIDGKAALKEFFRKFYGNAAVPMEKLYCAIENTYYNPKNYPRERVSLGGQDAITAWKRLGTPERMEDFYFLMREAKMKAKTETEKARVALFDRGIWQYMEEGAEEFKRIEYLQEHNPHTKTNVSKQPVPIPGGDASKVNWSEATELTGWGFLSGRKSSRKIESKITHDGVYLYIQLEDFSDPSKLVTTDDIWHGDDWEVFVAKQRAKPYIQLAITPAGSHVEYEWGDSPSNWDAGAIYTSNTDLEDRWQVRIALPLDKLLPGGVKSGDVFYANIYRTVARQSEFLAWVPTFSSGFQDVSRLAELTLD